MSGLFGEGRFVDERHERDPHPPDGVPERRCSDRQCREAREEWLLKTVMPTLMNRFYAMAAATVLALSGVFIFMNKAAINEHEKQMLGIFEKQGTHDKDITELKEEFKDLSYNINHTMNEILIEVRQNAKIIRSR